MNRPPQPGTPVGASPWNTQGKQEYGIESIDDASRDEAFGGCRSVDRVYERLKKIGEGTYGEVYLGRHKQTGEMVALKKIRMENEKEGFPITAIREIKLLKVLDNPNVIRLKEICRSVGYAGNNYKGSIYMVFDYMDHDLTGLLERRSYKLTLPQIKCYMFQLLRGLYYCHQQGVLHRDLKAANLLINNRGELKLADFGLARPYMDGEKKDFTSRVITLWYRPLELMLGKTRYGPEVDMWSVGCILAELLLGKALFTGKDEIDQIDRIIKVCGSPTEHNMPGCKKLKQWYQVQQGHPNILRQTLVKAVPHNGKLQEKAIDLLCNLLVLDPEKRLSALDAFGHDFFWKEDPLMCHPEELPTYEASHEMQMKQDKRARNNAAAHPAGAQQGRGAPPQQHGYHAGGPDAKRARHAGPQGYGGPMPGQMGRGQAVAAAAQAHYGGYGAAPAARGPAPAAMPPGAMAAPPPQAPAPYRNDRGYQNHPPAGPAGRTSSSYYSQPPPAAQPRQPMPGAGGGAGGYAGGYGGHASTSYDSRRGGYADDGGYGYPPTRGGGGGYGMPAAPAPYSHNTQMPPDNRGYGRGPAMGQAPYAQPYGAAAPANAAQQHAQLQQQQRYMEQGLGGPTHGSNSYAGTGYGYNTQPAPYRR